MNHRVKMCKGWTHNCTNKAFSESPHVKVWTGKVKKIASINRYVAKSKNRENMQVSHISRRIMNNYSGEDTNFHRNGYAKYSTDDKAEVIQD